MHRLTSARPCAIQVHLRLQRATQASFLRSATRACTPNSPFAHLYTRPHTPAKSSKTLSDPSSAPAIPSLLPRVSHRQFRRSYASYHASSSSPTIVYATIGACCLVFGYSTYARAEAVDRKNPIPARFMRQNMICSLQNWREGRWWTVLTSSFNHINLFHLAANMFTLYNFGPLFVRIFGARGFVLTWVASSVSCCGVSLWWEENGRKKLRVGGISQQQRSALSGSSEVVYGGAAGASGAILGLTSGLMFAVPKMTMMIFPIPVAMPLWAVNTAFAGFSGYCMVTDSIPYLGHAGHLGGMAGGLACGALLLRR